MLLEIVSPNKIFFSDDVKFVIIPGEDGDIGILDNHTPTVTNLRSGIIYIYKNDKIYKKFMVFSGVSEFTEEKCIILTEEILNMEEIKIEDLKKELIADTENVRLLKKIEIFENQHYS